MDTSRVELSARPGFARQAVRYGLPFGLGMALIWWAIGLLRDDPQSLGAVLLFGLVAGVIGGVFVTAYEFWHWKKVEDTELPDFSGDGELLVATPAIHNGIDGWLAANAQEILFRVRSTNVTDLHFPLPMIRSIMFWKPTGSSAEGIELNLVSGETERFELEDMKAWRHLVSTRREFQVKYGHPEPVEAG